MKGVLEILLDPQMDFDGKPWTKGRIETFNTELAKRKLTESGAPLSPSGRRTLEALLKYFGLFHMDNDELHVTKVGRSFVNNHVETFKLQMLKLQITNPVINEDCTGIQVFPFRTTLSMLVDPRFNGFLKSEEIGYILFMRMKHENDYEAVVRDILHFRSMKEVDRQRELEAFRNTSEGKVALVSAPSVNYYIALCLNTMLCSRDGNKLEIRPGKENDVKNLLRIFQNARTYDFGKNLHLWIDYFGDPSRLAPPRDVTIQFY
jgi:hypothetical protein